LPAGNPPPANPSRVRQPAGGERREVAQPEDLVGAILRRLGHRRAEIAEPDHRELVEQRKGRLQGAFEAVRNFFTSMQEGGTREILGTAELRRAFNEIKANLRRVRDEFERETDQDDRVKINGLTVYEAAVEVFAGVREAWEDAAPGERNQMQEYLGQMDRYIAEIERRGATSEHTRRAAEGASRTKASFDTIASRMDQARRRPEGRISDGDRRLVQEVINEGIEFARNNSMNPNGIPQGDRSVIFREFEPFDARFKAAVEATRGKEANASEEDQISILRMEVYRNKCLGLAETTDKWDIATGTERSVLRDILLRINNSIRAIENTDDARQARESADRVTANLHDLICVTKPIIEESSIEEMHDWAKLAREGISDVAQRKLGSLLKVQEWLRQPGIDAWFGEIFANARIVLKLAAETHGNPNTPESVKSMCVATMVRARAISAGVQAIEIANKARNETVKQRILDELAGMNGCIGAFEAALADGRTSDELLGHEDMANRIEHDICDIEDEVLPGERSYRRDHALREIISLDESGLALVHSSDRDFTSASEENVRGVVEDGCTLANGIVNVAQQLGAIAGEQREEVSGLLDRIHAYRLAIFAFGKARLIAAGDDVSSDDVARHINNVLREINDFNPDTSLGAIEEAEAHITEVLTGQGLRLETGADYYEVKVVEFPREPDHSEPDPVDHPLEELDRTPAPVPVELDPEPGLGDPDPEPVRVELPEPDHSEPDHADPLEGLDRVPEPGLGDPDPEPAPAESDPEPVREASTDGYGSTSEEEEEEERGE
jgi:hypothetical protein